MATSAFLFRSDFEGKGLLSFGSVKIHVALSGMQNTILENVKEKRQRKGGAINE